MTNEIDLQSSNDTRKITIDKVGVKNIRYPIIVDDRTSKSQSTVAELDIFVELLHKHRGTHMSRFIEVLTHFHKENLIAKLPDFLMEVKQALQADSAYTSLRFPYFIEKHAPISEIPSLLAYDCFFEASYQEDYSLTIGVHVPITSLCPCSKEISDYGAHNQRSIVTVKVTIDDFIWIEEIIELVESCASCEIYSLLKRSDEKYVTEKAFNNPRFVEDIVREVTLRLKDDKRIRFFSVESENFESIHSHNAYACVKMRNKK